MKNSLSDLKFLVTSGPTVERLDPVRYISNFSSGKQGYAIAKALTALSDNVTLISGPVNLSKPENTNIINIESADEMLAACESALPVDVAIFAAAVSDWKVLNKSPQKLKKQPNINEMELKLVKNPDILKTISNHAMRPKLVIGFAAETENVIENAKVKLTSKNCDWILANDVSGDVFGSDSNHVYFIDKNVIEDWGKTSKDDVAARLVDKIKEIM